MDFSTCTYKSDHISTVTSPGPLHLVLQMKRFINIAESRYFGGNFENMQIRT